MPDLYQNPVLDLNFADPFVLKTRLGYHAYATNSSQHNVQYAFSPDLVNWEVQGDALPGLPHWAQRGWTWAPEVVFHGGRYLMYYTVRHQETQLQVVSVATSEQPQGPFVDTSERPLVAQFELGGSIDASPFQDQDGQLYLLWKNDGNHIQVGTTIYGQKLSKDGLALEGEQVPLLVNDQPWEGPLVEAPTVHVQDGIYYLLYSANGFASDLYGVGYATGTGPLGPFTKHGNAPFLKSTGPVSGPGHQCLTMDDGGQMWLVYHAWTDGLVGDPVGKRSMRIDPIRFEAGQVVFSGPSVDPRPAPTIRP